MGKVLGLSSGTELEIFQAFPPNRRFPCANTFLLMGEKNERRSSDSWLAFFQIYCEPCFTIAAWDATVFTWVFSKQKVPRRCEGLRCYFEVFGGTGFIESGRLRCAWRVIVFVVTKECRAMFHDSNVKQVLLQGGCETYHDWGGSDCFLEAFRALWKVTTYCCDVCVFEAPTVVEGMMWCADDK